MGNINKNQGLRMNVWRGAAVLGRVAVISVVLTHLGGCDAGTRRLDTAQGQVAGVGGRTAAAGTLSAAILAGEITTGDALDRAFVLVETAAAGADGPASAEATAFAGAVLDAIDQVKDRLPHQAEMELFWMRVGRLAFASAEEAHARGRVSEARSLVLAGPSRWQTESYWRRSSGHDALASVILAKSGEREEARRRLESRGELEGLAAEVLQMLREGR